MRWAALTALAAMILGCTPVMAQVFCAPRDKVVEAAFKRNQERPAYLARTATGSALEVLASEHGKTWTVIVTMPNKVSCVVSIGTDWSELNPEYGVEG